MSPPSARQDLSVDRLPRKASLGGRAISALRDVVVVGLVVGGAIAVVIGTLVPWEETKSPNVEHVLVGPGFGIPPGWYVVRPFMFYLSSPGNLSIDERTVTVAASIAGLIGLALLIRRLRVAAGIVLLVLAIIAGRVVEVDYQQFSRWVEELPAFVNVELGPGPYLATIGILIWTLGGLIATVGRLGDATTARDFSAMSRFAIKVFQKP
jgi:hypothetical protein